MKKYISFFRIRFLHGLQYRAAAAAGIATQFFWGMMELLVFKAFYESGSSAFPMEVADLSSYIWLQQAFLSLFMVWFWERDIFEMVEKGSVAYELCRPVSLYNMWFTRCMASRVSKAVLRCMPILLVACFLPPRYRMNPPADTATFFWFLLSMLLAVLIVVAFSMMVYFSSFFTISAAGVRMVLQNLVDFLSGAIIPLPFLPDAVLPIVEFLPFASMANAPLRIYSGNIAGSRVYETVLLQLFWLLVLLAAGKWMESLARKKVVVQGG